MFLMTEFIQKRKLAQKHTKIEIETMVQLFSKNEIPEYQVAAWLMAAYFNPLSSDETYFLTDAMKKSGTSLSFKNLNKPSVDKHSTGGVGDKTTLIIAPLVSAAGVAVPLVAGRGLGHTGGTLDKLEAIPGFKVRFSTQEFIKQIEEFGTCIIGQTEEFCPADKKIYALRDVTSTVDSIPLICASIMSKKLALGAESLVLDVKFGSGAFMKTLEQAQDLALRLIQIAKDGGVKARAVLSDMNQPLGRFIGNSLEVGECIAILEQGSFMGCSDFSDTLELSLALSSEMLCLAGKAKNLDEAREILIRILKSGKALEQFKKMCKLQGGRLEEMEQSKSSFKVYSQQDGYITGFDTAQIGMCAIKLGAGRLQISDDIDHTAGIQVHAKIGDSIKKGEALFTLYGKNEKAFIEVAETLIALTNISLQKPKSPSLISMSL